MTTAAGYYKYINKSLPQAGDKQIRSLLNSRRTKNWHDKLLMKYQFPEDVLKQAWLHIDHYMVPRHQKLSIDFINWILQQDLENDTYDLHSALTYQDLPEEYILENFDILTRYNLSVFHETDFYSLELRTRISNEMVNLLPRPNSNRGFHVWRQSPPNSNFPVFTLVEINGVTYFGNIPYELPGELWKQVVELYKEWDSLPGDHWRKEYKRNSFMVMNDKYRFNVILG